MAFCEESSSQQIQMLNSQLQVQLQRMQETQQKQIQQLNKQLQSQLKETQKKLQEQINQLNTMTEEKMKQMQKTLQAQIKQIHEEVLTGGAVSKAQPAQKKTPSDANPLSPSDENEPAAEPPVGL